MRSVHTYTYIHIYIYICTHTHIHTSVNNCYAINIYNDTRIILKCAFNASPRKSIPSSRHLLHIVDNYSRKMPFGSETSLLSFSLFAEIIAPDELAADISRSPVLPRKLELFGATIW